MKNLIKIISSFLVFTLTFQALVLEAVGQAEQPSSSEKVEFNRGAQYYIIPPAAQGTKTELMMKVNVWGQVLKPGQYFVPDDTDLISLISYAGGPTENAKINSVRIIRSNNSEKKVLSVDIKKYTETADPSLIPVLMPGDTIIVSGSVFFLFSRFAGFVSQLAVVVNFMYLIVIR